MARRIRYHRAKDIVAVLISRTQSLVSRMAVNWQAGSIAARRGRMARIFAKRQSRGWRRGSGSATGKRRRKRVMEASQLASQPIVSEFVYDDGTLSKKFLWLTSTSSTRNTKVNPLTPPSLFPLSTELPAGVSSAVIAQEDQRSLASCFC